MTAHTQPSPEAVGLVAAALRAEREVVVLEERVRRESLPLRLPAYAAAIRKNDDASEALFAHIVALESENARLTAALTLLTERAA